MASYRFYDFLFYAAQNGWIWDGKKIVTPVRFVLDA